MTDPFAYPAEELVRRHGPRGYSDYARFRPWLRDEFAFRCVYCLQRERWTPSFAPYNIDHFLSVVQNPDRAADYKNLLYCCLPCNNAKRDLLLPDPTKELLRNAVRVHADGTIEGLTPEAESLIQNLGLDSPGYTEFRLLWLEPEGSTRQDLTYSFTHQMAHQRMEAPRSSSMAATIITLPSTNIPYKSSNGANKSKRSLSR